MRSVLLILLLAAVCANPLHASPSASGEAAWPSTKAASGTQFRDTNPPAQAVLRQQWSPLDSGQIEALKRRNGDSLHKVLQIGLERQQETSAGGDLTPLLIWRATKDGGLSARLSLRSPGAKALRLGLEFIDLPAQAELRFAAAGGSDSVVDVVRGADVAKLAALQPTYWTPVTEGDTQQVEIYLPVAAERDWLRVSAPRLSHLIVSPRGDLREAKIGESDPCEFDARCISNPSTAYTNAKNAVARMVFQTDGGSALCTGTLLNDTDTATQIPYFFGAAHCFTDQTTGNSLTTFWFYEATGCATGVLDSASRQVSGGAQVLFANTGSDVLFLRLNNPPPTGAFYLGWDSAQLASGTNILVLHHPKGDVKKVSLGQSKGIGNSSLASGSFNKAGYTDGTTERGSSGSGLLTFTNNEYRLRGGLLGGSASCENTGSISTPANSDDYSRLDLAISNISQFLTPSSTPSPIDYSGAWSNPAEDGWGLNVIRGSSGAYAMFIYHYDSGSRPAWYLSFGALSGTTYNAPVLTFMGPWFGIVPFNPSMVSNQTSGSLTVTFTSATSATISFTIDGRTASTQLTKLVF